VYAHCQSRGEVNEGNAGADAVNLARVGRPAEQFHQLESPELVAELEWQARQRETQEAGNDQDMQENVPTGKTTVLFMSIGNDVMILTIVKFISLLAVLDETTEHPEQCVHPEHGKCTNQQAGHADKGVVQDGILFAVIVLAMGIELSEESRSLGVALGAGCNQVG